MRQYIPQIIYLICIILVYPLIMSFIHLADLLTGRGARAYVILYVFLPLAIVVAIIFLLNLASELKQMKHMDD